jgi:hypothetical protein
MGYTSTFITVAEDCESSAGQVPPVSPNGPSVAAVQHQILSEQPYALTQEDVLFETEVRRRWTADQLEPRRDELRQAFSEHRRADLRSSPLPKRYGWGLHFDADGRIALVARETAEYERFTSGQVPGTTIVPAMLSRRRS